MLSRRHLRIKVLQALYAFGNQLPDADIRVCEKNLITSINSIAELYYFYFYTLLELINYIDSLFEKKILSEPTEFHKNQAIQLLRKDKAFLKKLENKRFPTLVDEEMLSSLYRSAKDRNKFNERLKLKATDLSQDQQFLLFLVNKVIRKSEFFNSTMEDNYINWQTDKNLIIKSIVSTIKRLSIKPIKGNGHIDLNDDWDEELKFSKNLLGDTVINDSEYQEMITAKTKNWDSDRIAVLDNILMKMALCELLNFPTIPVKVTMDEYIEISKEYSTPKSKIFINGVLDKLLSQLKKDKKIIKVGRGLKN
ncbi:MAG: transcription antitermination protein NusB [Bacteroidia bacterium]|nr:transcription antitermination protein NusB [Bacteroidia bacterium]